MSRRGATAAILLLAALAIRIGEIERTPYRPINDARFYLTLASEISATGDYAAERGADGTRGPTAYFPPAYPYVLGAVGVLTADRGASTHAAGPARIANALLGTATVALTGLIALELFGPAIALIALALAAFYPVLIELSAVLVAENLLTALVLGALYSLLRAGRSEHRNAWLIACGLLSGLAILSHENAVVALIAFALGAAVARRGAQGGALRGPLLVLGTAILTVAPWTIRNAVVLHRLIPVSDETGITLAGTYNPLSAVNPRIPYQWRLYLPERHPGRLAEPALSNKLADDALDYVGSHPLAPLQVAYHNTLRLLELEGSFAWRSSTASIDLPGGTAQIGVISFWILCALALAGAFTAAVRAVPLWVWLIPLLLALSAVLVNVETPRFREPIDPFLILAAACGLEALASALSGRLRGAPVGGVARTPLAARGGQLVEVRERLA